MRLHHIKRGQKAVITGIIDDTLRIEAYRFGITSGQMVECVEIIPQGPVIIKKQFQEIAIGRDLAKAIEIKLESWNGENRNES